MKQEFLQPENRLFFYLSGIMAQQLFKRTNIPLDENGYPDNWKFNPLHYSITFIICFTRMEKCQIH